MLYFVLNKNKLTNAGIEPANYLRITIPALYQLGRNIFMGGKIILFCENLKSMACLSDSI